MLNSIIEFRVELDVFEKSFSNNEPIILDLVLSEDNFTIEVSPALVRSYYEKFYIKPLKNGINIDILEYRIAICIDLFNRSVIDPGKLGDIEEIEIFKIPIILNDKEEDFYIFTLEKKIIEDYLDDNTSYLINDNDFNFKLSIDDFIKILSFDEVSELDSITFAFNKYGKYIYFEPDKENNKSYVKKI